MKRVFIIAAFVMGLSYAAMAHEELPKPDKPLDKMTEQERIEFLSKRKAAFDALGGEEKAAIRRNRRARNADKRGGLVRNTKHQTGKVVFANLQSDVPIEVLSRFAERIGEQLKIAMVATKVNDSESADPASFLRANSANAVIFVIADTAAPTLLVAPEDKWAKVNVAKLRGEHIKDWTEKELLRAFVFLCGGVSSPYQEKLCDFIGDPRQLDAINDCAISLDLMMRINAYLPQMGINPDVEATYEKACQEGWAPQPTNDVQTAIWKKYHTIPDKPITIEFDPRTDK